MRRKRPSCNSPLDAFKRGPIRFSPRLEETTPALAADYSSFPDFAGESERLIPLHDRSQLVSFNLLLQENREKRRKDTGKRMLRKKERVEPHRLQGFILWDHPNLQSSLWSCQDIKGLLQIFKRHFLSTDVLCVQSPGAD